MVEPLVGLLLTTTCTILLVAMTTLFFCCWRKKGSSDIDADPAQGQHDDLAKAKGKWIKDRSVSPGPEVNVKTDNGNAVQPSSPQCVDVDDELGDFSAVQRETEILRSYRKPPPPKNRARQSRAPRALGRSTENLDIFTELKEDKEKRDSFENKEKRYSLENKEKRYSSENKENIQAEDEIEGRSSLRDSPDKDTDRRDTRSSMLADIELTLASLHQEGRDSPTKPNTTRSTPPSSLENKGVDGEEVRTEKLTVLGRLEDNSTNSEPVDKLTHTAGASSPAGSPNSKQRRGPKVSPKPSPKPSPKVSPKPRVLAQAKLRELDIARRQEISLSQGKPQRIDSSGSDATATGLSETCSPEATAPIEPSETSSLGAALTIEPSETSSLGAALTTGPSEAGLQLPAMKESAENAIPQAPHGDVTETASSSTEPGSEVNPETAAGTVPAPSTTEPPLVNEDTKQINDAKISEEKAKNQEINSTTKASPSPADDQKNDSYGGQTQEQAEMNTDKDSLAGQESLHSAPANTSEVTSNTGAGDTTAPSEGVHVQEIHEPEAEPEPTTDVEPSSPRASSDPPTSSQPEEATRTDDNGHRNESEEGKGKASRIPVRAGSKPRSSPPKVLDGEKPTNSTK